MLKKAKNIFREDYIFLLLLLVFIALKIPYLALPYFWDEAWAYANATNYLYDHGVSLSPDAAPEYFTRGHPLFLHAMVAGTMKLFGQSPLVAHSFMLFICSGLLTVVYASLKKTGGKVNALFSVLMLVVLPVFFTQSVLLLSEITLVLFSLLMYVFYQRNKKTLYVIFGCLALLTKETAVVVLFTFLLLFIFENRKNYKKIITTDLLFLLFPFFFWGIYLIYQKSVKGWYFYPEHTSLISFSGKEIFQKFYSFSLTVFFNNGKFLWTLVVIGTLIYQKSVLRIQNTKNENRLMIFSTLFIVLFLLFSSLNFFSSRYVLIVSVCWLLSSVYFVTRAWKNKILLTSLIIVLTGFYSVILFNLKSINDTSPAYKNGVVATQQIISELEQLGIYDEPIYAPFLIRENLASPGLGYRQTEIKFSEVWVDTINAKYAVMDNFEEEEIREAIINSSGWMLMKECKAKNAVAYIYKKKSEPESAGN